MGSVLRSESEVFDSHAVLRRSVSPKSQRVNTLTQLHCNRLRRLPIANGEWHFYRRRFLGIVDRNIQPLVVVGSDHQSGEQVVAWLRDTDFVFEV